VRATTGGCGGVVVRADGFRRAGHASLRCASHDLAHESFHRIQPKLRIVPQEVPNAHLDALREAEKTPTFSRSFAYATGPAWGALREMGYGEAKYGGAELLARERVRDEKKQAMLRDFRARFVDGPVLKLPLHNMQFEMDPNRAQSFEPYGTIYPTLTVRDDWGKIVVKSGSALIASDWTRLTVPREPAEDYALTLNDGWKIEGDAVVKDR
jgi:hypothetical protein